MPLVNKTENYLVSKPEHSLQVSYINSVSHLPKGADLPKWPTSSSVREEPQKASVKSLKGLQESS